MLVCRPGNNEKFAQSSIFLAGPTSRETPETEWREKAIKYLEQTKEDIVIFAPEPFPGEYKYQVEWESERLDQADVILFWIPRDLQKLPGFTTNVEFGEWVNHPSRYPPGLWTGCGVKYKEKHVILGYPKGAPKLRYLHMKAEKYNIPICHDLYEALDLAEYLALKNSGSGDFFTPV